MSDMMKSFDTEPLMYELNNVLNAELSKMLSKYVDRYNLLENTHKQIMNLPSVRAEMNRENDSDSDSSDDITPNNKDFDVKEQLIAAHIDTIRNLRNEICELKQSLSKSHVCNTCDGACEKINIKLEIEDVIVEESIIEDVKSVAQTTVADDTDEEDEEEEDEEEEDEEVEDEEEEEEEEEEVTVIVAEKVVEKVAETNDDVETENEEEEEEEESDDFFEIEIDDITYCTNDEETGIIYELDKDGDVGKRVGYLKAGEPFFDNE